MSALEIFPRSGFDQSATTPVFLGVVVSWLFTEAFGWVFAGLVVPGYLAAVFLLSPRSAAINVVEAIATYAIARLIGEHLPRTGLTSRLFGRERFFLVVLVSIVVRLMVEGVVLQGVLPHSRWAFSIGLVVVPLAANACWKTGLGRGLVQNGLPALVVYLLLAYVFVPYTNLSLASFNLATENIAASFLASPKAYILLLTGALVAAYANLRYGWDYNGILIPALLALVVTSPVKLAATIAEVLVLLAIARLLIKWTPLGRWNIEGPRRPVLFFTLDYVLRFVFAIVIGRRLPGQDVVDLMGFGYLLPTLLAVKISQKQLTAIVVLPAVAVSSAAFVLGTLLGFGIAAVDDTPPLGRPEVVRAIPRAPSDPAAAALWAAALARPEPLKGAAGASLQAGQTAEIVEALLRDADAKPSRYVEAQKLDRGVLLVRERFEDLKDRLGEPAILARPRGSNGGRVVLSIARPLRSPESAALAGKLVADGIAGAAVIAGVEGAAQSAFSLQVGASEIARAIAERRREGAAPRDLVIEIERAETARAVVHTRAGAAKDARLAEVVNALGAALGGTPEEKSDQEGEADARVEIPLERAENGLPSAAPSIALASATAMAMALDGVKPCVAAPSLEDLLALRRLVIEPMLAANPAGRSVPLMRFAAAALGYRLQGPSRFAGGGEALALLPGEAPRPLAVIARTQGVKGAVVVVPHGLDQSVRDFAIQLEDARRADAILIGLAPGEALLHGDVLRMAHAVAVTPAEGREAQILLVRDGPPERDGRATLASWGAGRPAVSLDAMRASLAARGITAATAPLDLAARTMAARSTFGDSSLAVVTLEDSAARAFSLGTARVALRAFQGLPVIDGPCGDAAVELAATLPKAGPSQGPKDILQIAERAALEQSIVAHRELDAALGSEEIKAAIARANSGVFLVLAARDGAFVVTAAIPIDGRRMPRGEQAAPQRTVKACGPTLESGGICRSEAP